jgi:hypothetical protein
MFKFEGIAIIALNNEFENAQRRVREFKAEKSWEKIRSNQLSDRDRTLHLENAEMYIHYLGVLNCPYTKRSYERLYRVIKEGGSITIEEFCTRLSDVASRYKDEFLDAHVFIASPDQAKYWARADLVTDAVKARFPEVPKELRSAGSSYCCALWTACVFHCMRAAESGLRTVANELKCDTDSNDNMKVVIDAIQKAANKIMDEPRSVERGDRSQHYSRIAIEAGLFKDAWRNHVAHARVSYDADEAMIVLNSVIKFFEKIVKPIGA